MTFKKKAQLEVSFNWIFVLIAGGAILIFFIVIIGKQTNVSAQQQSIKITENMKTIITYSENNPNTFKENDPVNFETEMKCEDGTLYYGLKDSSYASTLDTANVFSTQTLGPGKIYSWSTTFSAPYSITSMLYLSDENTMYLFDNDTEPIRNIAEQLPNNFNKLLMPASDISKYVDQGLKRYIIITNKIVKDSNTPPGFSLNNPKLRSKATILKIVPVNPSTNPFADGTIQFWNYTNPFATNNPTPKKTNELAYATKEMLFGAIISGNPDLYQCTRGKILQRTRLITDLNENRTNEIYNSLSIHSICKIYYGSILTSEYAALNNSASNFDNKYDDFYSAIQAIATINSEVQRSSCVPIY